MKTYLIAIDQSTSATKMLLVDRQGRIAAREALAHRQYYPQPGWVEHDAEEIWANVSAGLERLTARAGLENIEAIAISNQRETSVIWDCRTGRPLRRAIVWQDVRAQADEVFCLAGKEQPAAGGMSVIERADADGVTRSDKFAGLPIIEDHGKLRVEL